jgi:hypothetical protein
LVTWPGEAVVPWSASRVLLRRKPCQGQTPGRHRAASPSP